MPLLQQMLSNRLVSPISVWGKLPEHGDYLRYRCNARQAHDWQRWMLAHWDQRGLSHGAADGEPLLGKVPVAFVLQPGALDFAPKRYLQGVIVASHDRVGRASPLVFFQECSPAWMRRTWESVAAGTPRNQLYWLSRLAACIHGAGMQWQEVTRTVEAIACAYAPDWHQLLGASPSVPDENALQAQLNACRAHNAVDSAKDLQGVQSLPWSDWPHRLLRKAGAVPAYWQQDARGGYVNAADTMVSLWKGFA